MLRADESGRTAHGKPRWKNEIVVRTSGFVPSLKGLGFVYDAYPGLTTGATIVPPFGLRIGSSIGSGEVG